MTSSEKKRTKVFVSYSHEDSVWLERLKVHMKPLIRDGLVDFWDDTKIRPGMDWRSEIREAISSASVAILLISADFLASEFIASDELPPLLEAAEKDGALILPIILSPSRFTRTPSLSRFQSVNPPDRPLISMQKWEQEEVFVKTTDAIESEVISPIIGPPVTKPGERRPSLEHERVQKATPLPPEKTLEPGTVFRDTLRDGSKGPEMVVIPAGQFEMGDIWGDGDEDEKPVHTVYIRKPFALGRYPVTVEQYDTFATATGRELPDDCKWGRGQRPVIRVSWNDAVAYAEWLSQQTGKRYRLPSEAEWEYVARSGGKKEKWAGTSAEGKLSEYAWYGQNSGEKTQPVGRKKPNGLGLYDMSGNVWEWVQDCWNEGYVGAPDDGSAWESGDCGFRVLRGGSWNDHQNFARCADRDRLDPDNRFGDDGFRCAKDLE